MSMREELQWNSEPAQCADCGRALAPQTGYRFYADEGARVLCPSCYQDRLSRDDGGSTHDLIAEVDGGSG